MSSLLRTVAQLLEVKSSRWFRVLGAVGGVMVLAMMMVTVSDAIGRRFFAAPIAGAYEAVQFLLGILFFSSIVYAAATKAHLAINMITSRFKPEVRLQIVVITYFISTLLSWLLVWQLVRYSLLQKASNVTGFEFTFLPVYPFVWWAALCSVILGWVFLVQGIGYLVQVLGKD